MGFELLLAFYASSWSVNLYNIDASRLIMFPNQWGGAGEYKTGVCPGALSWSTSTYSTTCHISCSAIFRRMACYDVYDQIPCFYRQTCFCYLKWSVVVRSLPWFRLCIYEGNVANVCTAFTQALAVFVGASTQNTGKHATSCITKGYWLLFYTNYNPHYLPCLTYLHAVTDRRDRSRIDDTAASEHKLEARRKPAACCSMEGNVFINKHGTTQVMTLWLGL